MSERADLSLMHGLETPVGRAFHAELRGLTGREERLIADCPSRYTPAECASELIAAITERIGPTAPVTRAIAADLVIGDRERILLALAALTFGPRLDLVATCPDPACGAVADVPVDLDEILAAAPPPAAARLEIEADLADGHWTVDFRLPTGGDQEQLSRARFEDAARRLVTGCVTRLVGPSGEEMAATELPVELEAALSEAFERLDPCAEATTTLTCPACGARSEALLDGFSILHAGLGRGAELDTDIYRMARAYHWSEADILALPHRRRHRYLAIAAEMEARP